MFKSISTILALTGVLLLNESTASAQSCHDLLVRASPSTVDRQWIRQNISIDPSNLWIKPLISGSIPNPELLSERLLVVAEQEKSLNGIDIQSWDVKGPKKGEQSLDLFPIIKDFDQNYKFVATENAIIHVPNSPDSLNNRAYVYLFRENILQEKILLDEWFLANFERLFGRQIVLYRATSKVEAEIYLSKNQNRLIEQMSHIFKKRLHTYNSSQPTLHLSAEVPISWANKDFSILRFEVDIDALKKAVQSHQARVNLYGSMIEVQIFTPAVPLLFKKPKLLPPLDFENMKPNQIESFLREVDQS